MKKAILSLVLCAAMASTSFAGLYIGPLTLEWSNSVTGFTANPSCGTYNWATNHFLYCDYGTAANTQVRIGDNVNGALTGGTLSKTGLTLLGALGFFAICTTSDGAIYAGSNESADGLTDYPLIRWASETDTAPTNQVPTPMGGTTYMAFPRAMDAIGTGVDTIIGVTGDDNYQVKILTTTNGTAFAVTDTTPAYDVNVGETRFKQGVALASDSKIFGTKNDGSADVAAVEKVGGNWVPIATFTNPTGVTLTGTAAGQLGSPAACGYASQFNDLFLLGWAGTGSEKLTVLHGGFGTLLQSIDVPVDCNTFAYGAIDVDDALGVAYFAARGVGATNAVVGKVTFEPYSVPLAVNSSWGLYE